MLGLRYVYVLALAVWIGSTIAVGALVAPATFASLTSHDPEGGRLLAGMVFGEVLRRYYLASYAAGAALLFSLIVIALLGPRPGGFFLRLALVGLMFGGTLYAGLVLTGQIDDLQKQIGVSVATLAASDPRRVSFGRLHGLSTGLMALTAVGGLILLYWEAKE
jgi:hypothetical protein